MKKTIKISVKIKNCELVFKDGLEPGVIATQKRIYDLDEADYSSPMFAKEIMDKGEEFKDNVISIKYEEED